MEAPKITDYYKGAEMSALNADKFTLLFIESEMIQEDMKYYDTKWWDYRDMHPAKATLFFYHTYLTLAPDYITRHVGRGVAQGWQRSAQTKDLRKLSTMTVRAIWKARMAADALGVPYEIYIRAMLRHFYDTYNLYTTTKDGKQILPYPTQMTTTGVLRKVEEDWDAERKVNFHYPQLDPKRDYWFKEDMEEGMYRNARHTKNTDYYIRQSQQRGFISTPS